MANLPTDELPSKFDIVLDGTGLIQSILGAALVCAGKSVLHLDRNGYYGEHWASLMHRELKSWISREDLSTVPDVTLPHEEGTIALPLSLPNPVSNIIDVIPPAPLTEEQESLPDINQVATKLGEDLALPIIQQAENSKRISEQSNTTTADEHEAPAMTDNSTSKEGKVTSSMDNQHELVALDQDSSTVEKSRLEDSTAAEELPEIRKPATTQDSKELLHWESMQQQWRMFSFDIIPKVLYCRGAMVDLLTQSNCSRYTEFKAVQKIYRVSEGTIEHVPCSRADLFSSQAVSMLEKRRMMKFLTFCANYDSQAEAFQECADAPFDEFLQSRGLGDKIIDYIAHSIAMVGRKASTKQALEATKIFLTSLGRFGNAPFLYPLFGVGELGQAYCRLCAVYGGVYCLRRSIAGLLVADNTVSGIVCTTGQRIETTAVVCSARHLRDTLNITEHLTDEVVSRAMIVTDGPLPGTDGRVTVVTVPPLSTQPSQTYPVTVLQLDPSSNCSAPGTYLLHLTCPSTGSTAQSDLEPVIRTLLDKEGGPHILRSLFFNISLCLVTGPLTLQPTGVYMTSDPDSSLNYEGAVKEAQRLFEQLCPGEEFLPTPPDPKDIIYDTPAIENEPGEGDSSQNKPSEEGSNQDKPYESNGSQDKPSKGESSQDKPVEDKPAVEGSGEVR